VARQLTGPPTGGATLEFTLFTFFGVSDMLFIKCEDNTAPHADIHAHGVAARDMGSDLLATKDVPLSANNVDGNLPIQSVRLFYDGVFREAYLILNDSGKGWVVLASDGKGLRQAIEWAAKPLRTMRFAGTIS